ncbi:hypothetical protein Bca52824_031778 [Brassica carinata]|uniref:Uncharacterized protein n=1 Tax=Brassica carinata TaxID=52824 RepID=A0A8X7SBA8_BRACI|nr:hypothetical protein Bca52824_031778 [Brassica carinata]
MAIPPAHEGYSPGESKKDEFTGNQEKDFVSISSDDVDEEEAERLLCIRDALESLESQLAALHNIRQRQQYEKQVALSEIDYDTPKQVYYCMKKQGKRVMEAKEVLNKEANAGTSKT